jgi:hypothetical protein
MEERLAQQREEMEECLAQEGVEHRLQMDAMSAAITKQFTAQMVAYKARFCSLKESTVVSSKPEVTTERAVHDLGSFARHIVRSSTDSIQGNNQIIFLLSFNKTII